MTSLRPAELPAQFVEAVVQHVPDPEPVGRGPAPDRPPHRPDGATWLAELPGLVAVALERWELVRDPDEPLRWGFTALVLPVLRSGGSPAMLKVGWPHPEADHEHLALRSWNGRGAVRLLAAEPADTAYLLERLDPNRDLETGSVRTTTEALGRLLARLDLPAPPWARPLSEQLQRLQGDLAAAAGDPAAARFPRRMLQHAASLVVDLLAEDDVDTRLVHTDLHQMNVLWRPDPGEWVAIDPKVVAGDPHWVVAPSLWNRWADSLAAPDLGAHLLGRLEVLCEAAGLDRDRARAATILRMVQNALWAVRDTRTESEDEITRAVAIVKAMQRG
ncbi:aminoglycoside phosphotransferase family protein [Ornithinimicrobium avium]|uniref:aminoglycoside phosphotransferase family protein n=1 Tax=Ornithinimicrobium avium TaxID=2283195 RepID=UPI0013B45F6E|nr:aminoglycoside phosphotransferase family protein [Ornithinimicrobium avium]